MLRSYLVAMLLVGGLMVGWALVQRIWGRVFQASDDDVLALRGGCGSCGCATPCSERQDEEGRISIGERTQR